MISLLASLAWAQPTMDMRPEEQAFTFEAAGDLVEDSGEGRADQTIYVPGLRFPMERAPAYLNSQVHGRGGFLGPGGRECDAENYQYPWRDNYCETRRFSMPLCPAGTGHQGQDIRPATCDANVHWAVATVTGTIVRIGSFSVTLISDDGTEHRYLHLEPSSLVVQEGDRIDAGARIGRVSNTFFDRAGARAPTTVHLHYDIQMNLDGRNLFVPPYTSLVEGYRSLLRNPEQSCAPVPTAGRVLQETDGCADWFGPAQFWRRERLEGSLDNGLYWTNAHGGANPSNFARFRLTFESAGRYRVEAHVVPPRNRSTQVPYVVRHAGTVSTATIDQTTADGPTWLGVGTFDFAAGADQWVEIRDNTGEAGRGLHLSIDSVRVVPVSEP